MFKKLQEVNARPTVFGAYTAESLWSDSYRANQMLSFHLNEHIDVSSRNHQFIESSVEWIKQQFSIGAESRVCDFGCGPGLYANKLAGLGAEVTGIDFSIRSIEYASDQAYKLGLNVEYIKANYLDVSLTKQYDLITMIMCDFCALNPKQRKSLLIKFYELLSSDGRILLDVYSLSAFEAKEESAGYEKNHLNHFWFEEDYYCFSNTFKYDDEKVMLDKYSLFTESGKSEVVYNWLQCFDIESFQRELVGTGLRVQSVFADVSGNEYDSDKSEFAVIIEKIQ